MFGEVIKCIYNTLLLINKPKKDSYKNLFFLSFEST